MTMTLLFLMLGVVLLVLGAELLVRGASRIAAAAGIPSLVIGLTVVAFGTSAPELAVSLSASFGGRPDITVGNVVGSNIFNVLAILGISALAAPLIVSRQVVRSEVPVMVAVCLLPWLLGANGVIGRLEGAALFATILVYTAILVRNGRRSTRDAAENAAAAAAHAGTPEGTGDPSEALDIPEPRSPVVRTIIDVASIAAGLGLLVLGSRWLVASAVTLAQAFGLSELVIGLTIVAAGTSLPELATSLVATVRGERDIAVGNIVGSNIFNVLCILGFTALVSPGGVPVSAAALGFDIPVMTAVALACLPVFFTGHLIARWEGALFLGYYVAYTAYLVLDATNHDAVPQLRAAILYFALPLTILTMAVVLWRGRHDRAAG